jgi:hypothetical protein
VAAELARRAPFEQQHAPTKSKIRRGGVDG